MNSKNNPFPPSPEVHLQIDLDSEYLFELNDVKCKIDIIIRKHFNIRNISCLSIWKVYNKLI